MRPNQPSQHHSNPQSSAQGSTQGNTGNQTPSPPTTGASTSQPVHFNSVYSATHRMKPVTGIEDTRYRSAYRQIRGSPEGKRLKGISRTGVLADPTTTHDYPKLTLKSGKKEGAIISHFYHPREYQGQRPHEYMRHQQLDTAADQAKSAQLYPLGFRKHDRSMRDENSFQAVKDWATNPKHPKASLAYLMPADPSAKHKRPRVNVDGGKYYGHLVTFLYGPDSPPKQGSQNNQPSAQDNAFANSLLRSRTPSPDAGRSSKRLRIKDEPQ